MLSTTADTNTKFEMPAPTTITPTPGQKQQEQEQQNQQQQAPPSPVNPHQQQYPPQAYPPYGQPPQPTGSPQPSYVQPGMPTQGYYLPPSGYQVCQQQQQAPTSPVYPYQHQYLPQVYPPHEQPLQPPGSPQPGYAQLGVSPQVYYPPSPGGQYPSSPPGQYAYPPQAYPPQGPSQGYPQQPHYLLPQPRGQFQPQPSGAVSGGYIRGVPDPNYNPKIDAEVIRKALSVSSIQSSALIHIIPQLTPAQVESIKLAIYHESGTSLADMIDDKLPSSFKEVTRAILLGPMDFDVWLLNRSMSGLDTKEKFLNIVLLGRKNGDMQAIKSAYESKYSKPLVVALKSRRLGDGVEGLFLKALDARRDETGVVDDAHVEADAKALFAAMTGSLEALKVAEILATRSNEQIEAVGRFYDSMQKGKNPALEGAIKKAFSGHMEDALLYILRGARNRADRDAKLLEGTMKGIGTKNEELNTRLAILHWDRTHMEAVKAAYKLAYPKRTSLLARVKDETSGDHRKILLALLESSV